MSGNDFISKKMKPKSKAQSPLTKKTNGKSSFVSWKNCTFVENSQHGTRRQDAWFCSYLLRVLSTRKGKIRKTGTYADLIIQMMLEAWKTQDVKFFKDIATTLKRSNVYESASLAAQKLSNDYYEVHEAKKKNYSLGEIMYVCGVSNKKQARRVRDSFNKFTSSGGGP